MTPELHYLLALGAGFYVGGVLHELSHWFVGWIGDTDPSIQWAFYIFPNGVNHGRIETMDSSLIRLSGVAVFLWIPPGHIAGGFLLYDVTPATVFIAAAAASTQMMATESDVIAVRDPERFRQMWMDDAFPQNPLYLPNWVIPDWLPRF